MIKYIISTSKTQTFSCLVFLEYLTDTLIAMDYNLRLGNRALDSVPTFKDLGQLFQGAAFSFDEEELFRRPC